MPTSQSVYGNYDRLEIEGSFDLSATGTVSNISYPAGVTATCRGDNLSVARSAAGTYVVTYKNSSAASLLVQVLAADCAMVPLAFGTGALGTTLFTRITNINQPTSGTNQGDIQFTILTSVAQGGTAADESTVAKTICFQVVIQTNRMGLAL